MTPTSVFRNVRPLAGEPADLAVADGQVVGRAPAGTWQADGAQVIDGHGMVALPTLVDAHIHPDKTAWGEPWVSRAPASGIAALGQADVELGKRLATPWPVRVERLLRHAVSRGTRAVRAHADVAPVYGLAALEAVAEARDALRGQLDVQLVAFPQHGVVAAPGTADLLERAATEGLTDLIGGIDPIGFDDDLDGQLDVVFGIADRHGTGIDIHLHDRGEPGVTAMRAIVERTRALGLNGRVTVSHAFCVPLLPEQEFLTLADELADAGVGLTTVAPSRRAEVQPVGVLRERGVLAGLGSDGVRDAWDPFGDADMLHRAHLFAWVTGARTDQQLSDAFAAAADGGAELLGLPAVTFEPGSPADFMLVDGECVPQIVVDLPPRTLVVKAGRIVAGEQAA